MTMSQWAIARFAAQGAGRLNAGEKLSQKERDAVIVACEWTLCHPDIMQADQENPEAVRALIDAIARDETQRCRF